jgi:hypothetical protein
MLSPPAQTEKKDYAYILNLIFRNNQITIVRYRRRPISLVFFFGTLDDGFWPGRPPTRLQGIFLESLLQGIATAS